METPLTLKPTGPTKVPVRAKPDLKGWVGEYIPGKGGDANLMIMLHGVGDTHKPFANLAKQMQLPYTAVLSLQAPLPVPLMGESYMWYPAFDSAFNSLPPAAADPSGTVAKLRALLESLAWSTEDVHLFGFAQGGGMALALALSLASDPINESRRLGSVVTVLGGLEGKTPSAPKSLSHTPVLFYTRTPADPRAAAVKDRFAQVTVFTAPSRGSMPASMDEWRPIMGFWGQVLKRDEAWKGGEVYEVVRE